MRQRTIDTEARGTVSSKPLRQLELPSLADATARASRVPLDIEKYRAYLQHTDLSEEQKAALLQTLWSIASTFVDLAFGRDSVQQVLTGTPEVEPDTAEDSECCAPVSD